MTLRCGTGIRDITPSFPVYLHGYADRDHPSTGISEPVRLGCLAVDDGESRILLVTVDAIGVEAMDCARLYEMLEAQTGIAYPQVLVAASHTHFAPALQGFGSRDPQVGIAAADPCFVEDFETKLVEAARESLRTLAPATLESARMGVPQVLFNRRTAKKDGSVVTNFRYPGDAQTYDFSPTDTELTVLRFRGEDGLLAALANFGCHPVTGGEPQAEAHYHISGDYPHYLREELEAAWACPVFFTLGAAGDAVPLDRYGEARRRIGQSLAHAAVLAERAFAAHEEPRVGGEVQYTAAETIVTVEAHGAAQRYEEARQQYTDLRAGGEGAPDEAESREAAERYSLMQGQFERSRRYPENRWEIPTQFVRVGDVTLVGMPFEVLSEISLRMKAAHPHAVLVSCAGGYQGYLPLDHETPRGGYEVGARSNHFVSGTGDRLLEGILQRLGRE